MTKGVTDNPWVWAAEDYQQRKITISVSWNSSTRALISATLTRDVGCLYGHIYIGTGADASPNSSTKSFAVPVGTSSATAGQLAAKGLNTIDDVLGLQITAGP